MAPVYYNGVDVTKSYLGSGTAFIGIPIVQFITSGSLIYLDANNTTSYPGSGATWFDLSPNGYNATLQNSPTFNSTSPKNFQFNGTTQTGTFAGISSGSNASNFTWGGWVAPLTGSVARHIFSRGRDSGGGGEWNLGLFKDTANKIAAQAVLTTPSVTAPIATAPNAITNNAWIQIFGVLTQGSSLKLYINGALQTTTTATGTNLRNSTTGWRMAEQFQVETDLRFNGRISTMNVYNRALSDTEILQNFDATKERYGL